MWYSRNSTYVSSHRGWCQVRKRCDRGRPLPSLFRKIGSSRPGTLPALSRYRVAKTHRAPTVCDLTHLVHSSSRFNPHLCLLDRQPFAFVGHLERPASHSRQTQPQQPGARVLHHAHGRAARRSRLAVGNDGPCRAAVRHCCASSGIDTTQGSHLHTRQAKRSRTGLARLSRVTMLCEGV